MQSITQKYLKNEYLPINSNKNIEYVLLNTTIRSELPNKFGLRR